jgi:hypothetical protein
MPHTKGHWAVDLEQHFTLGGDTVSIEALSPDRKLVIREVATCMLATDGHPSQEPSDKNSPEWETWKDENAEWEEDCANAQLVAAAPALLVACKMVLDDPGLTASANDVLRDAIAQAERKSA